MAVKTRTARATPPPPVGKTYTADEVAASVYGYFLGKGFTPAQAAGITGNVQQESSFNPNAPGGGLFQDIGGRGAGQGASIRAQLDKALAELPANGEAALRKTKTPSEAARVFSEQFERPGVPNLPAREKYAEEIFAKGHNWTSQNLGKTGGEIEGTASGGVISKLSEWPAAAGKLVLSGVLLIIGAVLVIYGIMVAVRPRERALSIPVPGL